MKASQILPGSASYWKWASCVPSVGPRGSRAELIQKSLCSSLCGVGKRIESNCLFVSVLPNSELLGGKCWAQNIETWTELPQALGTSLNSTVNFLKPRREGQINEDIQKHPHMSGNLESHVQTQDRRYTQKRPIKIVVSPPADLCDLWKQEPRRVIISAEVVSQWSTVNILKCPVFNKKKS